MGYLQKSSSLLSVIVPCFTGLDCLVITSTLHLFVIFSLGSYLYWQCSRTGLLFPFCAFTACTRAWLASQQTFPAINNNAPTLHGREKGSEYYMNIGASDNM